MRALLCVLIMGLGLSVAAPALAADRAWTACAGSDDDNAIAGCSKVIARGSKESRANLAIAYYNRGVSNHNKGDVEKALADYEAALALNPDYANPYNGRANIKADRGDLAGALTDYDQALKREPMNARFLRNRGLTHAKKDDLTAGLADLDRAVGLDPTSPLAVFNRGEIFEKQGDRVRALADYRKALALKTDFGEAKSAIARLQSGSATQAQAGPGTASRVGGANSSGGDPTWEECASSTPETSIAGCSQVLARGDKESVENRALAYRNRAISRHAKKDYAGAAADLEASLALQPDDPATLQTRGETLARQGRCDRAVEDFARVMQLEPKNPASYLGRSDCRRLAKDYDAAIADANQAVAIDAKSPGPSLALGNVYSDRNEFDGAVSAYDSAIGMVGDRADIYVQRGNVQLFRGHLDEAFSDYDRAANLDANSADALNGRGVVENFRGQQEAAIADFTRAIALDASLSMLFVNRGEVLLDLGRKDEAAQDLRKAIAMDSATLAKTDGKDPAGFNALLDRAYARVLDGDLDGGIADANGVLAVDPRSKEAFDTRGLAYAGKKNFAHAIADLSQGIAIGGYVTQIYRHRAETYEVAGNLDLAVEDYEAVLRFAPGHAIAKTGLARAKEVLERGGSVVASFQPSPEAGKVARQVALGRRVALVIANGSYQRFGQLPNPKRDANRIAATLRNIGFTKVTLAEDLTNQGFNETLRAFSRDADGADWAVIYYAGHGMEINGTNYLVPVDAQLQSDRDAPFEAVPLDRLVASVEVAKGMRLVILDACRENPFSVAMQRTSITRAITRGLARVEPEGGTLVAYSAKAGQLAQDGDGDNSPFVTALASRIETPGIEIGKLFRLVRDDVLTATGRQQEPFVYGSLPSEDVYINPPR
jgi:tetratricopeptide (TPR) repeat protein